MIEEEIAYYCYDPPMQLYPFESDESFAIRSEKYKLEKERRRLIMLAAQRGDLKEMARIAAQAK